MNTLIFGHKNPDTDSICSAIAYGMIKTSLGESVKVCRLGDISKETQFILDYLNLEAPALIEKVEDKQEVILVDHNEFNQSVNNIENAKILEVVDHHRVANFNTAEQVYMNVQPVGCTATILFEIAKNNNVEITKELATVLVSAIISDSLLFKSPTCTERDKNAALELAKLAELNVEEYGMDLLKAGTDLSDFSAEELINIDSKEFQTDNGLFEVAQINTVDINEFLEANEAGIITAVNTKIADKNLDLAVVLITDIVNSNTMSIVLGNKTEVFENGLKATITDNKAFLEGVVSRKKQVVPFL